MSTLTFDRANDRIFLRNDFGEAIGDWEAMNNVDSHAKPWPPGNYRFSHYKKHADDAPNSSYGSVGIFVFAVPEREGMGVHSGRRTAKDGRGRIGPAHATMGCIRTTDEAMTGIKEVHDNDPIKQISVS